MATKAKDETAKANGRAGAVTEYVVLEQRVLKDDEGNPVEAWVVAGNASNTIRVNAITEVAGEREGVWRAVPIRNWADAIRTFEEVTKRLKAVPVEPF